jgi:transcriptional adapter 2-alpha
MDLKFDIDPGEFHERKRRRIATMNAAGPPPPKVAPVSVPGIHEVTTFLPGRLEFEHELDNDAEDLAKDLEIGVCLEYGGDLIPEDENDQDVRARARWAEEKRAGITVVSTTPLCGKSLPNGMVNGLVNGHHIVNGDVTRPSESQPKAEDNAENGTGDGDNAADEITQPPPIETKESLSFKLTLLEMYVQRVEKRRESKAIMFDRGLLEYKKVHMKSFPNKFTPTDFRLPDASCRKEATKRRERHLSSAATICQATDCGRLRTVCH